VKTNESTTLGNWEMNFQISWCSIANPVEIRCHDGADTEPPILANALGSLNGAHSVQRLIRAVVSILQNNASLSPESIVSMMTAFEQKLDVYTTFISS
jgi:hypothetical protein